MNYPVRQSLLNFFQEEKYSASEFISEIQSIYGAYERENTFSHFLPLGSHDTERIRTALDADLARTRLAFQFIFTYPGAPTIFYGDEVGLRGEKDPDCRQAFPWEPSDWEHDLRDHIRSLISVRKGSRALRRGELRFLSLEGSSRAFAFSRLVEQDAVVAVFNASPSMASLEISVNELGIASRTKMCALLDGEVFQVQDGRIALILAPWQGRILTPAASPSGSIGRV
jgi:glycosidase